MESNPDYLTIIPALKPERFNVVVMRYRAPSDEYYVLKTSLLLTRDAASDVAKLWADKMGLEIR